MLNNPLMADREEIEEGDDMDHPKTAEIQNLLRGKLGKARPSGDSSNDRETPNTLMHVKKSQK